MSATPTSAAAPKPSPASTGPKASPNHHPPRIPVTEKPTGHPLLAKIVNALRPAPGQKRNQANRRATTGHPQFHHRNSERQPRQLIVPI